MSDPSSENKKIKKTQKILHKGNILVYEPFKVDD